MQTDVPDQRRQKREIGLFGTTALGVGAIIAPASSSSPVTFPALQALQ